MQAITIDGPGTAPALREDLPAPAPAPPKAATARQRTQSATCSKPYTPADGVPDLPGGRPQGNVERTLSRYLRPSSTAAATKWGLVSEPELGGPAARAGGRLAGWVPIGSQLPDGSGGTNEF